VKLTTDGNLMPKLGMSGATFPVSFTAGNGAQVQPYLCLSLEHRRFIFNMGLIYWPGVCLVF